MIKTYDELNGYHISKKKCQNVFYTLYEDLLFVDRYVPSVKMSVLIDEIKYCCLWLKTINLICISRNTSNNVIFGDPKKLGLMNFREKNQMNFVRCAFRRKNDCLNKSALRESYYAKAKDL